MRDSSISSNASISTLPYRANDQRFVHIHTKIFNCFESFDQFFLNVCVINNRLRDRLVNAVIDQHYTILCEFCIEMVFGSMETDRERERNKNIILIELQSK